MKISGLWVLFFVLGASLMFLISFSSNQTNSSIPDAVFNHDNSSSVTMMAASSRKLKENAYNSSGNKKKGGDVGNVNLDDYRPIDPAPSSKASIKPKPINHNTPTIPYIPRAPPGRHP